MTRVNAEERERTNKRVCRDLEGKRRKRGFVFYFAGNHSAVFERAFDRLHFGRRRHIIDYSVEYRLYALVLKRRTAERWNDFARQCANTNALHYLRFAKLAFFKVKLH